jgi:hypothetical protein
MSVRKSISAAALEPKVVRTFANRVLQIMHSEFPFSARNHRRNDG